MRRRRAPNPLRRFPGEDAWQWHLQLEMERIISPLRVLVLAVTAVAWAVMPHPPSAIPLAARADIIAGCIYAIVNAIALYRFAEVIERWRWGSTLIDAVFVVSWLAFTGGRASPFGLLAAVALSSVPLRNPPRFSLVMTCAYAIAIVALCGLAQWYLGAYLLVIGVGNTLWTAVSYRDRRNALRDDLTGSFTRDYADFRLADVYEQGAFPIAVAVIDLDGFKHVNDTFGHPAGDAVLVQAVRTIAGAIRQGDLLARSGGDEFMLILPRTGERQARAIGERVRAGIEFTRFRLRRDLPPVRLTASVGIAVAGDSSADSATLIARADERLYEAKESGRNRVIADPQGSTIA